MDLVGSIKFVGNRLGGRKPNQGRAKPVQKNARNEAVDKKNAPADDLHSPTEYDTRLGQKLDITA